MSDSVTPATGATESAQSQAPLAHNTDRSGPNKDVPVIVMRPSDFPFAPNERESEWHPATDTELEAFDAYWQAQDDA